MTKKYFKNSSCFILSYSQLGSIKTVEKEKLNE